MGNVSSVSGVFFVLILGLSAIIFYSTFNLYILAAGFILAALVSYAIKLANQWERAVVLRLGKFKEIRGPGLFLIIPIVDTIPYWIDLRIITTDFKAEQTLTKDNVPVDVDGVLFWKVEDPEKSVMNVQSYINAVSLASQTSLRDIIGRTPLADMISDREKIDKMLAGVIESKSKEWGVDIQSVEIREVRIPTDLQDAMSRQAQAERERQARVILGDSETQIAEKFAEAAKSYVNNPTAMHLRAMNMLYEGLKEKGALVIVPSTAVETMGLGGIAGLTSLSRNLNRNTRKKKKK
jgi:regulator of protease activity HflC (stomatin/prohibitin superfamily)